MPSPPLEVARILGHSSVTTTMTIYAHAMVVGSLYGGPRLLILELYGLSSRSP
jgi:hypothetical protein